MNGTKKLYKYIIAFSIIMFEVASVFGQSGDSLINQFETYAAQDFQEKIFVHTDKTFYLTGEVIWFKIYVTDAVFHKPSDISKIAYIELVNIDSKVVLQGKIEIGEGSGNGSLLLPGFLSSGNYTMRAYTNWMKNKDADYYFQKNLSIVNASKNAGNAVKVASKYDVLFFPEGGQLVTGLPSTVAFQIIGNSGQEIHAKGYLLNSSNDTVLELTTERFGIGKFNLIPSKGEIYKAVISFDKDNVIKKQLPKIYEEGIVMHVIDADPEQVKVKVKSNIVSAKTTFLFVHSRSRFKAMMQQTLVNGEATFILDKRKLNDGISHFTLFNDRRQPVCERLYFKRPIKNLDLEITTNQTSFSLRSKVNISIVNRDQQTAIAGVDLSLSAFLLDSLQTENEPGIAAYLLLSSDLPGKIESPDWYLTNSSPEANIALDNLMLTHGWRRFKWEEIQQDHQPYFKFLPELEGSLIKGKILDKTTGLPTPGVTAFLSIPNQQFHFSTAVSDSNGNLLFNVRKFYGNSDLVVQTNTPGDSNYRLDISKPFSENYTKGIIPPLLLNEKWKEQLLNRSIYSQVENSYLKPAKNRLVIAEDPDSSHFFGKPDKTYNLDEYTRFTTMEEVMREFVAEVRVRKTGNNYNFKVRRPAAITYFDSDPLVLLDGVPVFNFNKIIETDPLRIKRIEVTTHKYYAGSYVTDGLISYSSYDGRLGELQLDHDALIVEYEGLQREREFYSPVYNNSEQLNSSIPDFRNVLYWSPSVDLDESGRKIVSFYTSDLPGKYAVMVQGITKAGVAGSKLITIDVK